MMEWPERGGRKRKVLDLLKFWTFPYLLSLYFSHFASSSVPFHFSFSLSIRGPVQFVSRIVCEGLSGVFFERWKGVCVEEGERESWRK